MNRIRSPQDESQNTNYFTPVQTKSHYTTSQKLDHSYREAQSTANAVKSKTVNNKHISMFTFYRTTTDRMSRFPRRNVRTIYNVWISAEVRTCYIFKITNISDSLLQYTVFIFWRLSIFKETHRHIDIDRPTGRWAEI